MRSFLSAVAGLAAGRCPSRGAGSGVAPFVCHETDERICVSTVYQFGVGSGGLLAPLAPPMVAAGTTPRGVAVSPDGKSVYVTSETGGSVSQYTVGAEGTLAPKTIAVAAGTFPYVVAVSPDEDSVYVTNSGSGSLGGAGRRHAHHAACLAGAGAGPARKCRPSRRMRGQSHDRPVPGGGASRSRHRRSRPSSSLTASRRCRTSPATTCSWGTSFGPLPPLQPTVPSSVRGCDSVRDHPQLGRPGLDPAREREIRAGRGARGAIDRFVMPEVRA